MSDAPLVVVLGPTAVGKSALAVELARRRHGAIVSADAMQVYRGFDVGTAKPGPEQRATVPHYMVDIVDPREDFSAGDFVRAAEEAVSDARARGLRPFLVGGTGLYIRSFLHGIFGGPRRSASFRERLRVIRRRRGLAFLYRMLTRVDPRAAARLGSGDEQRIVRALEVRFVSGRKLSEHLDDQEGGGWAGRERFPCIKIGLSRERAALNDRIDRRVRRFFADGLVEEVRGLLAAGISPDSNAFKGIGYRQVVGLLAGRLTEEEAIEETARATRQYAKRQMTWFRRERNVHWLDAGDEPEPTVRAAESLIA